MKAMIIKDYNTGKVLATKKMPKAGDKSISYEVRYIGCDRYLVVEDYHTGEVLHKFNVSKFGSIEFYPKEV